MYGYNLGVKKAPSGGGGGAVAPVNTVAPEISGSTTLGSTLSCTTGTWTGSPNTFYFSYQWTRNGSPILFANSNTYVTTLEDSGAVIACVVTANNCGYVIPSNTVAPSISGTAVVGQTLTSTTGTWTSAIPLTYNYQWKRGTTNIGTNSPNYTLVQADAGNTSNITCIVTAVNEAGVASVLSNQIAQILTARTSAFLTASSISDATITGALNTMDISLISNSLDTKMRALYPIVGGTASTHKWNFMDARDLDAAFRLTFSGTVNHSSTGMVSNGTNGFYNTNFNCTSSGSLNNQSLGVYIRNNVNGGSGSLDFGTEFVTGALIQIYSKFDNSGTQSILTRINDNSFVASANADSRGWYCSSRTSSTSFLQQKNTAITTITANSVSLPTGNILGFKNTTTYTAREQAFAFIGNGLTNTEMTNLYSIVQTFQTTLGRQV